MDIIVSKFGGTSMGNAQSIRRVVEIIQKQSQPSVVVVSAVHKITDQLLNLGYLAVKGENWEETLKTMVQDRHQEIIDELKIDLDLSDKNREIKNILQGISLLQEMSSPSSDHLSSFGERISSLILSQTLKKMGIQTHRFDTRELIMTDDDYGQANVDFFKTNKLIQENLLPLIEQGQTVVLTGFIGQSSQGKYSTLGRGGSDFTGAIVAAALGAQELDIWTDVDGICSTNPHLIRQAQVIPELSFAEAGELAYFGAKVLYPKTIAPVIKENIPIRVLNTFNPQASGTLIKQASHPGLKAITFKSEVVIMTIRSGKMLEAHGFLARIFNLFAKHRVAVDVLATSEISLSLTINIYPSEKLIQELSEFSEVCFIPHQSIVCLVGDQLFNDKNILSNLFTCLQDYPVKMISQGASERNITFLVNQSEVEEIVKKVYQKLFTSI